MLLSSQNNKIQLILIFSKFDEIKRKQGYDFKRFSGQHLFQFQGFSQEKKEFPKNKRKRFISLLFSQQFF